MINFRRKNPEKLIILDDDKEVGFIIVERCDTFSHIKNLVIQKEFRGMGYGKASINFIKEWGVDIILTAGREGVLEFYFKLGFVVDGDWDDLCWYAYES